jgi:hypothetical protein
MILYVLCFIAGMLLVCAASLVQIAVTLRDLANLISTPSGKLNAEGRMIVEALRKHLTESK